MATTQDEQRRKTGPNGLRGNDRRRITKSVTIRRAPADVYRCWRDSLGGKVVDEQPNERIAWRADSTTDGQGAETLSAGVLYLRPAPGDRGTEVRLELLRPSVTGVVGATLTKLLGRAPKRIAKDELRAFKQVMETGDVVLSDATVEGGPHPARPPKRNGATRRSSRGKDSER